MSRSSSAVRGQGVGAVVAAPETEVARNAIPTRYCCDPGTDAGVSDLTDVLGSCPWGNWIDGDVAVAAFVGEGVGAGCGWVSCSDSDVGSRLVNDEVLAFMSPVVETSSPAVRGSARRQCRCGSRSRNHQNRHPTQGCIGSYPSADCSVCGYMLTYVPAAVGSAPIERSLRRHPQSERWRTLRWC